MLPNSEKLPPNFDFQIDWATDVERKSILKKMLAADRQIMNLTSMPTSKLLVLKDKKLGKIIGWEGLDFEHNPKFPEVFSQFVEPEYRSYLLGLALSHACACVMDSNGIEKVFLRMESATNDKLLNIRTTSKIYKLIPEEEIDMEWKSMCKECNLYGSHCTEQAFLYYNTSEWVEFGNRRLGYLEDFKIPQTLTLKKEIFRSNSRDESRYRANWVA